MDSKPHYMFSLKDLDQTDYFLGIKVKNKVNGSMSLSQSKQVSDLLTKSNMIESKSLSSHMEVGLKISKNVLDTLSDLTMYRYVVGALQYATIIRLTFSLLLTKHVISS